MKKHFTTSNELSESLSSEYFSDVQDIVTTLHALRITEGKSAKQRRLDARQAHAIEKRIRARSARLYALLGDTSDFTHFWAFNPTGKHVSSTRRNNRNFRTAWASGRGGACKY